MRKIKTKFMILASLNLTVPGGFEITDPLASQFSVANFAEIIVRLLQGVILPAAALAAFIFILVAGYQFITSTGDPKAVESARMRIWMALLGFLLVMFAWTLLRILEGLVVVPAGRVT